MTPRKRTAPKRTKRERKAIDGKGPSGHDHSHHIHCVACGVHLDPAQFTSSPGTARWMTCEHRRRFASCTGCVSTTQQLLDEHDRSGQPVAAAPAFH